MTGVDVASIAVSNHGSIGKQLETALGEEARRVGAARESLLTARLMIWGSFSMLIFVKMRHLQMRPCPLTPRNKVLQTSTILEGVPSQQGHGLTAAPPDRSWQVALGVAVAMGAILPSLHYYGPRPRARGRGHATC